MYAVIRTGGKQYKVAPQDVLQIEKIEGAAGEAVQFPDVLMVAGEGEPSVGSPLVSGAVVSAEVVEQGRGPKVIIFKKRRRQNYRRKKGHRQDLTTVRILEILTDGRPLTEDKEAVRARANKPEADAVPETSVSAEAAAEAASANSAGEKTAAPKKPRVMKAE